MIEHPFSSLQPYEKTLWVGFATKDDALANDEQLQSLLGTDRTVELNQVHGNRTCVVRAPSHRTEDADGIITDAKNLTLTIRIADCQAFLVYAPKRNVVGLLHAGWKGLVCGAIPSFFAVLKQEFGIDGNETLVCIGPSLGLECSEFSDPLAEFPGIDPKFFQGRNVDLQGIADAQLKDCGVTKIERMGECTKCEHDKLWSYRSEEKAVLDGARNVLCCKLFI